MSSFPWITLRDEGLYCEAGHFYIDPVRPVERAVISHGHTDHARPGHQQVWATPETLAIMAVRYGTSFAHESNPLATGQRVNIEQVTLWLAPAGHVLGSAQLVMEYGSQRVVYTGDYKRRADPTCLPFEVVPCDLLITEATFAMPVYVHPPVEQEIVKLVDSLQSSPARTHLLGVYSLGKAQRMMAELRRSGYHRTIYLHGALEKLTGLYEAHGISLGPWKLVSQATDEEMRGALVLCPPRDVHGPWSNKFQYPLTCAASGWMQTWMGKIHKGEELPWANNDSKSNGMRSSNIGLPLVISDHADWPELIQTIRETGAKEVWVVHGRGDLLVKQCRILGVRARALRQAKRDREQIEWEW